MYLYHRCAKLFKFNRPSKFLTISHTGEYNTMKNIDVVI